MTTEVIMRRVGNFYEARGASAQQLIKALRGELWTGRSRCRPPCEVDNITGKPIVKGGPDLITGFSVEDAELYLARLEQAGVTVTLIERPGPCPLPSGADIDERIAQHAAVQAVAINRRKAA